MYVDSFSWMPFYLLLIFSGPHKVKPYIWNQTNAHSRRKVRFMLRSMCVVLWSVHMVSGRARAGCINPTLRLVTAAFYSGPPSDLRPFALSSNSHQLTARNKWGHVETARTDWINPRQTAGNKLKPSGVTIYQSQRSIPTDLSAPGQVEVEEIAAALSRGQVHTSFICESVAVGQTQELKVEAVPV